MIFSSFVGIIAISAAGENSAFKEGRKKGRMEGRREGRKKERKEMFYFTTHSTQCIYSYMASDKW